MIVCIEVSEHFKTLVSELAKQIKQLEHPITHDHYNRIQTPIIHRDRVNILTSGTMRLEANSHEPLHTTANNQALAIFEKGDLLPVIGQDSSFRLISDGAVDIEQFEFKLEHLNMINTSQALFIELFAAQISQQESFTPSITYFKADEIILNKDESGDTLHTLIEGRACAEIDGLMVGEINSGESFGVVAALTNGKRSADVRAAGNCMVMSVPADSLENMIKHNPHLSLNIMKSLANNLLQANQKAVDQNERQQLEN